MEDKVQEIVDLLDRADELFHSISEGNEQANPLWDSGIEKLSAAIWLVEKLREGIMDQVIPVSPKE